MRILQIVCLVVMVSTNASALNVQKFNPIVGQNYEGVGIYASYGLQQGQFETGLYLSYLRNALEFGTAGGGGNLDIIAENFLTSHFQAAYGISDRLTLRASLPFNFYSDVEAISNFQSTEDMSMGDLMFNATITLIERGRDEVGKWGLAVIPFLTVPLNNEDDFFGEDNFTGGAYIALDRYLGKRHYVSFNIGTRIREREEIVNLIVDDEFLYGASYVYRLSCDAKWDLFVELIGSTTYREFFSEEVSSPYEGYIGLRKRSQNDHWEFTGGIGRGGNEGYGAPDYHLFAGLSYLFFGKSTPARHCCEEVPVEAPPAVGRLEVFIKDQRDIAITRPIQLVQTETNDIIYEGEISMMSEIVPAGRYKLIVMNEEEEIESMLTVAENDVVKETIIIQVQLEETIEYVDPIYFDVNEDKIQLQSFAVLDDVIELINKYEGIEKIIVEAHTDSDGSKEYNLDLSKRRAKSVETYLIEKGVDPNKISTIGYGEADPRVPNTSRENKALNRRVDFNLQGDNLNVRIINK